METQKLFYPQISARTGPYIFNKGIEVEAHSSKTSYFDWAKIRFTEEFQPKIALARRDEAAIEFGYDGVFNETFTGPVAKPYNAGGFADEVNLKDEMLLLEDTTINNTFLDTALQEMIAYCLTQAGISEMKLVGTAYLKRAWLPIRQMNVIEVINTIHAAWGTKRPFSLSSGVFYWDRKSQQSKVHLSEHGVNILSLTCSDGVWKLETVSAPFAKHPHKTMVRHPKVSGEFEVPSVKIITNEDGFIRTYINF